MMNKAGACEKNSLLGTFPIGIPFINSTLIITRIYLLGTTFIINGCSMDCDVVVSEVKLTSTTDEDEIEEPKGNEVRPKTSLMKKHTLPARPVAYDVILRDVSE